MRSDELIRCGHCGYPHVPTLMSCPYTGRTIKRSDTAGPDAARVGVELLPICGTVVGGVYRVDELLAAGGMGAVYRCHHERLGRAFALKVVRRDADPDFDASERFLREARAAARIDHPNVVAVHDVGELPDGCVYIVMELLEGLALSDYLAQKGPLPVSEAVDVAEQILRGLGAAHAIGVVHRDVKPGNVFLARMGGGMLLAKVVDFSLSRLPGVERLTATGQVLGTPHFLAPEQAAGSSDVDGRADLWATGVVLYQMLTGRVPFDHVAYAGLLETILERPHEPASRHCPDVPPELDRILDRALAKLPVERYQTAHAMIADLLALHLTDEGPVNLTATYVETSPMGERVLPDFDDWDDDDEGLVEDEEGGAA